ncbi:MAG: Fic family protein [Rickettsiales bacterium]|jgi:Fic family protein|nr:Fic family protein [Rickettsiales bacterium]
MQWNWELKDWPHFSYDSKALEVLELEFMKNSGKLLGAIKHINKDDEERLRVELVSDEALKTSKIEGEILDRDSLQSSVRKQFGLKTDNRKIPPAEQGIATMMVDLYKNCNNLLTEKTLCNWHRMLMNNRIDVREIGRYRTDPEPMQIISDPLYKSVIHYEAPPARRLAGEMSNFIKWFNAYDKREQKLSPLLRASIAHWYFVCIHPFEDGNGRIARALSEYSLAQSIGHPTLIALAYTIELNRKEYYAQLAKHNRSNKITEWILYFSNIIIDAQKNTERRIDFLISKAKVFDLLKGKINSRQEKVLLRMFREGIDGFKGGLSANNYISITNTTTATASRDLKNLVDHGVFRKEGSLKHTRYHLNLSN